jgi:hypothetical protein
MHDLLIDAARRGIRYRTSLAERCVAPTPAAVAELARFREPMPAHGCAADAVLTMLDETGSPATVAAAGGRYFGFVNGSSLPVTVATTCWSGAFGSS